ncbi:sigma-54-dependent Fis family transcriptional regulator [Salinisphaera aquimarina]|uniref:Sigma-54-dependent Fis family transcriptional regulator n=1 Tax=Salinisphaera aquimarina TaxID=2094031 RepID=A0ABV7EKS2_9GAMM
MATVIAPQRTAGYMRARGNTADVIAGSWDRCIRDYGLDPAQIDLDVVSPSTLSAHRDELGEVVSIARAEMENLAAQISGSGYALLLTDAEGVILYNRVEQSLRTSFRAAGLWDGADWSEGSQGTNGIGTCIFEQQPLTVHCTDHFASRNTTLSCSASPIRNSDGALLAVLDASSVQCEGSRAGQMHTMALVSMSARLIEKCVFLNANAQHMILRFHSRPEFVSLIHDGMVAVDEGGTIVAADDSAACQLGFDARTPLIGRAVAEVFDIDADILAERASDNAQTVWPMHEQQRGRRYFATVRTPAERGRSARVTVAPSSDSALRVSAARQHQARGFADLAGSDTTMAYNVRCARRVADRQVQIMLRGETGTGKELFARAIHAASRRSASPFVAVNCAAIPESLIESELFGYKPGAFTGARRDGMRGKILQSSGGTLFLDEIGDMPVELQTRLLRVLEEREVVPLGSETPLSVDLNVISATHADLTQRVDSGSFREDLYYRLNGITLTLPAVRERTDRQSLLRSVVALEHDGDIAVRIAEDALEALVRYNWPGNIRQMRNVLRTALALCDDLTIGMADLPAEITRAGKCSADSVDGHCNTSSPTVSTSPLDCAERAALLAALDENRWNISHTASQLGMSRNTLYRKMKKHEIPPSRQR